MKKKRQIALLIVTIMFVMALNLNSISFAVETLQSKVDAIEGTGEIVLDGDYTDAITIPAGKTVTIDLNGHTLDVTGADAISNKGTLTLKGNGSVTSTNMGAIVNYPGATCTVNGGDYLSKGWYTIKNMGTMTINNLTFTNDVTNGSSMIANGFYGNSGTDRGCVGSADAKLTINGGTFENKGKSCNTIKNDDWGVLEINGGTFKSSSTLEDNGNPVIMNWHMTTINDGTFTGSKTVLSNGNCSDTCDRGEMVINGGTFSNNGANYYLFGLNGGGYLNKGVITTTGGTFDGHVQNEPKYTDDSGSYYTFDIRGGTFNNDVKNGVAEGYSVYKSTADKYIVAETANLSVEPTTVSLFVGTNVEFNISGADGLEDCLIVEVGDSSVASLEANTLTGVAAGETTVSVGLSDGTKVEVPVTVAEIEIVPDDAEDELNKEVNDLVMDAIEEALAGEGLPTGFDEATALKVEDALLAGKTVVTRVVNDGGVILTDELKADLDEVAPEGSEYGSAYEVEIELVAIDADGNEEVLGTITALNGEVTITLVLPKNFPAVAEGYQRTYSVVRFHATEAPKVLPATDNGDGTISTKSDKFSTYVITYVDTLAATNNEPTNNTPAEDTTVPAEDNKQEASNPKTGDIIMSVVAIFAIASVGLVIADKKRKNI